MRAQAAADHHAMVWFDLPSFSAGGGDWEAWTRPRRQATNLLGEPQAGQGS